LRNPTRLKTRSERRWRSPATIDCCDGASRRPTGQNIVLDDPVAAQTGGAPTDIAAAHHSWPSSNRTGTIESMRICALRREIALPLRLLVARGVQLRRARQRPEELAAKAPEPPNGIDLSTWSSLDLRRLPAVRTDDGRLFGRHLRRAS
jgi:hypothetical protein